MKRMTAVLSVIVIVALAFAKPDGKAFEPPSGAVINKQADKIPELPSPKTPPKFYIDKGVCPGEGCSYSGKWKAKKITILYARPDTRSPRVGQIAARSEVVGVTSEVHTVPSRFIVKKAFNNAFSGVKYKPGDVLWVYTYYGEGNFLVWFDRKMYAEDLGFGPWGGTSGNRCQDDPSYCWGELDREHNKMVTWVKFKTKNGLVGWTKQWDNFISLEDTSGK